MFRVPKHGTAGASRRRRRGSTIVEASFCFLVFFCWMLGVFDFGQFLFLHQALVERARWSLRYAIANQIASGDTTAATADDPTCASEGIATCAQNVMLYYSSTAGTTAYYGLTSSMVQVSTIAQTALTNGSPSPNPMPASTPSYNAVQILITGYRYNMYAPFSVGQYLGPNIYETFPLGQY